MTQTETSNQTRKLTLITDAWQPQVNGVVTTLNNLVRQARLQGIEVDVIHPHDFATFAMPFYPEIRIAWYTKNLEQRIIEFRPDAVHIATEGPLGWRARRIAQKYNCPFTTSYHTKFPEYIHQRLPWLPESWLYKIMRHFHRPAVRTLVPTASVQEDLLARGFTDIKLMSRGVDTDIFNPSRAKAMKFTQPMHLYVGRVAIEKNLEAFLDLDLPGSKIVVGSGPSLEQLKQQYPDVNFVGSKFDEELASYYASAAVLVFPSKTDTFGVVNIEAIACGTPVAAYPVTGPKDIITQGVNGVLNNNLAIAIEQAKQLERTQIADSIPQYTWQGAAKQFIENLAFIKFEGNH
ncbi:glycosyltransferase family 1 protein [Thiomicrorhabdus sp. 6S2-11]|uniref:Glycosyltransferase family 1 protein n=1 Tax=Thiomicrorhabdus marina TaxID=2818442 RepID=A0ABS3Q3W6_9GAMM|nr:glycosyltransferase family 1 protein [Thiomicrorhabdus marina]MBO1927027.1 glycosyltransferase family 1 protein [Thiomicrorhabdus marina]